MFEGFTIEDVATPEARIRVRHAGDGPVLVLLHGHPRTGATWHHVAPALVEALQLLREAGGNPFTDWQIPAAVIALKQGAGRLIRDVHDRGVLVLCDPRLSTRNYGKLFLASLPPLPRTRDLGEVVAFFH